MSSRIKWSLAAVLSLLAIVLCLAIWGEKQIQEVGRRAPRPTPRPDVLGGIPVPAGGGYRIPVFGTRQKTWDLYQAEDGHLIYGVLYYEGGEPRSDYWDPLLGRLLFPAQAHAMANSPGSALAKKLRPSSWKKIEGVFSARGPDGLEINHSYEGGSVCHWAYSNSIDIESSGDGPHRFALLRKRDVPQEWSSPCGGHKAMLHYEEVIPEVIATDSQGFLAILYDEPLLLKFDWDGRAPFLKGREDIIAVPYRLLQSEDGAIDIATIEARIAKIARDQRRGIMADLIWSE